MRFAYLGSGSRGNSAIVEHGGTRLLVDCGFSAADAERRLQRLDASPDSLTGILVTHEHDDHLKGVARLARKHGLPVWMTPGTHAVWGEADGIDVALFSPHEPFAIDDLEVWPYPVPHDAREPCQLVVSDGARRLGVLSDAGRVTPHIRAMLAGCHALLLECNHDPDMLEAGPYPPSLKRRVAGDLGHLSNAQAAELVRALDASVLQHAVVAHISEQNNTPERARAALADALGCASDWVAVADQREGLTWRTIAAL